jgi:MFS family permease
MKSTRLTEVKHVLGVRSFAIYTACNSISMVGVWMQRLTVGWLAWQLTASEAWVGAIAFADLVPVVLIGPIAGVWVDRPLRRLLIKACQLTMLLQSLVLFFLSVFGLINIWGLFGLVLVNGIVAAIYHPVRLSVVPSLVGTKHLIPAVSLTAITFHMARFAGPALGGMMLAWQGIAATFLAVTFCYSIMLAAVLFLKIPSRPWLATRVPRSVLSELRDGFDYVRAHQAIAWVLLSQLVPALLARPVGELLPAFVGSVLNLGAQVLALLTSAMGIGAVCAGLRTLFLSGDRDLVRMLLASTVLSGVMVSMFLLVRNTWLAATLIGLAAYWITVCGIVSQTLIQSFVEPSKRGRVISIWAAIYRGTPGVGALVIGYLASIFGLAWTHLAAALVSVFIALWMYRERGSIRKFLGTPLI